MGQESMVRGHWSEVSGHWSEVTGQESLVRVKSQWSKITGQTIFFRVAGQVSLVRVKGHWICVTHKSTVARTVMCRQDGRGRFPVLLDDLSKCRTNWQRKSQLRIFYMTFTLNDIYKQYNKLHEHLIHKNQFTSLCRGQKPASKMHQTCIWNTGHMQSIAGPVLASAVWTDEKKT